MKYLFTIITLCFVGTNAATAQQLSTNKNYKKQRRTLPKQTTAINNVVARPTPAGSTRPHCGFARTMAKAKAKGFDDAAYETTMKRLIQRRMELNHTAFTGIVTIPVVFHSIYRNNQALSNTTPHLTDAMYQAQIDQMNADYANLSGSTYGVAADVRIRFCLALVDTAGRVMGRPGVDTINGQVRGWSNTNNMGDGNLMDYFDNVIKPASIWDPYSYFNVWTAAMNNSDLLGYATFPSLSTLDGLDELETSATAGCVINWQSIGSLTVPGQDADFGFGRTLTHESGHFFGLRHIWGDDACGEDYCNDTPTQQDATTGCPSNDVGNRCIASIPTMFQNYMDYTDDACVNTFTANQAIRCQAAMDNSPRRFSLMGSKACTARAGNAIGFATATPYTVSEKGNAGVCPNTKSYSFKLYVSNMATGAATINFTIAGSTATQNADYAISPSTVTYSTNDNTAKTVTITVYDDQAVESTEQIQLGYTITGAGVVTGPDKQTISLYIVDDDVAGVAVNDITPSPVLLSQNFDTSTNIPTGWTTSVTGDGVSTPNQWVVSANGGTGTTGNAAHITRVIATKPNQYINTNTSDAYLFSPLINASGVSDVTLSFKWRCLGEEGYDEGYIGYIPEGQAVSAENVVYLDTFFVGLDAAIVAQTANINLPASLTNTGFYLVFNWENDNSIGENPPFTVDDVLVTGNRFAIATTTDADTAFSHSAGQTVSYYSKTGNSNHIIATISNPNEDLGCVAISVQSAGTGRTALTTTSGSYFRTDKVIKITPATANTTATYQATLYFSAAELAVWGTEISSLKILKVKDGVSLASTIGPADAELIAPTFVDQSETNGYYSYTGSFTGFSQFMLVSSFTVVPVGLVNFDAKANKNSITLTWATSQETNSKGFTIERSTNGTNFESIGWINGKGNSTVQSNYSFNDNFVQPNIVYYYRLRQVDTDGREIVSPVRKAIISKAGITVTVSPVPVRDVMNVFIKGSTQQATINLVNTQGQLIKTWSNINAANNSYALNVADLPAGIYVLNVILQEEKIVRKVMIEK